jgi:hypothetical protein
MTFRPSELIHSRFQFNPVRELHCLPNLLWLALLHYDPSLPGEISKLVDFLKNGQCKVNLSFCLIKHHSMKTCYGGEVELHALNWGASMGPASCSSCFTSGERGANIHSVKCWIARKAGLDATEKSLLILLGMEPWFLGRPARSAVVANEVLPASPQKQNVHKLDIPYHKM